MRTPSVAIIAVAICSLAVFPQLAQAREPSAQAEFLVVGVAKPDAASRMLDYTDEVVSQPITYADGVELLETPEDPASVYQYAGRAGATLWRMKIAAPETEPAWCWREGDQEWTHPFFCYVDRDRDGRFDIVYEIAARFTPGRILAWGKVKTHKLKPVAYRRLDTPGLASESITLRYMGIDGGFIDDRDEMTDGIVRFRVSTGRGIGGSMTLRNFQVHVRPGSFFRTPYGHVVRIDKVLVDGRIVLRLVGAPGPGALPLSSATEAP